MWVVSEHPFMQGKWDRNFQLPFGGLKQTSRTSSPVSLANSSKDIPCRNAVLTSPREISQPCLAAVLTTILCAHLEAVEAEVVTDCPCTSLKPLTHSLDLMIFLPSTNFHLCTHLASITFLALLLRRGSNELWSFYEPHSLAMASSSSFECSRCS